MAVDLRYPTPKPRAVRFIAAAKLIAGPGTGWPVRFVALVESVNENRRQRRLTPLHLPSTSHLHNIESGKREVSPELERLVHLLGPGAVAGLRRDALQLEELIELTVKDLEGDHQ